MFVRETAPMLHVTNGDSAVDRIRSADAAGDVLPWRDALHEGPVPAGLDPAALRAERARFVSSRGWEAERAAINTLAARDERLDAAVRDREAIVLWFESDLYDVLQLAQILDRVPPAAEPRLVLVGTDEFVGVAELATDELRELMLDPDPVTDAERERAAALWEAFRAPAPAGLQELAPGDPFGDAAQRQLQQLPWAGSGLNRTERALLDAVAAGARTREEAFLAQQQREERPFMGDSIAFDYLATLPLTDDLRLTDEALAILAGEREWEGRPERAYGGVVLPAGDAPFRYDPDTGGLA
jgi:hypothetical protein